MSNELPLGWANCSLGDIIQVQNGYAFSSKEFRDSGVPLIKQSNLDGNKVSLDKCVYLDSKWLQEKSDYVLHKNDVLIGMSGSVGKLCIYDLDQPAMQNQRTGKIVSRSKELIEWRFFWEYLKTIEYQLLKKGKGLGVLNVSAKDIESLPIRLAPLNEQRRIAIKLEKILDIVDSSQKRLAQIPLILKRFRQSILTAACSGSLTSDWRDENPNVGNAEDQIKEGRFKLSERDGSLSELPETWAWVPLGNYARCFRGKFTPRPRNDPRYFEGKHPFIQIGNLPREGGFITSHTQTLNDEGLAVSRKFPKGTVVIAIVGATIGNAGVLAYDMCMTDSLVGIETGTPDGNFYIELFLRHKKQDIRQSSYSSGGQPNINLEFLNPYPIALPPFPEQQEIVRRLNKLFSLVDKLEERYKKAQSQVDKLTQSILAKAFHGELVPQDPNDEPASVLLLRIKGC